MPAPTPASPGVEDLAGKRVWLGPEGSGTRTLGAELIAALGWTDATLAAAPDVRPDDVPRALCAGELDAFFYAVGHPALVVQEATTTCDARLVPITGGAVDALVASDPALVTATIAAGLYRGNPAAVDTFGVSATLVTREDVPDDTDLHASSVRSSATSTCCAGSIRCSATSIPRR